MLNLQHNIVSILYSVKGLIESHIVQAEEGRFEDPILRLQHAETVLKKAYAQSSHAVEIIKKLGRLLKANERPQKPRMRVSIKKGWRCVLEQLSKEFSLESIEIIERIPDHFPAILCEWSEFEEILYHLVKNGIQAMERKGKLILRAQLAFSSKEEPYAMISLSDTGPGIPEEKLAHLFKPFFTTKAEGEGNGLGLYLAKELVTKNGGKVSVSSFIGCGTTFTLAFSLAKPKVSLPAHQR